MTEQIEKGNDLKVLTKYERSQERAEENRGKRPEGLDRNLPLQDQEEEREGGVGGRRQKLGERSGTTQSKRGSNCRTEGWTSEKRTTDKTSEPAQGVSTPWMTSAPVENVESWRRQRERLLVEVHQDRQEL